MSACGRGVDEDQARICRSALPAIEPGGSAIEVLRTSPGPEPFSVRVGYRVSRTGNVARAGSVTCRFAAEGLAAGKSDLVGLATGSGPVTGATLYILKHYYLDTPDGIAGDPGPGEPTADVPDLPPAAAYLGQQLLLGLPRIGVYALLAAAYALLYGLVGRINFAFGEIAAVGAIGTGIAVALAVAGGVASPLAGIAVGLAVGIGAAALHGAVAGRAAFGLVPAGRAQASLVATVGLSLALSEYLRLAAGAQPAWIAPLRFAPVPVGRSGDFIVMLSPVAALTGGAAILAAGGLVVLMRRSAFGRDWRAWSQDALAASLFGIDGARLLRRTAALSGALAGLAGGLVAVQFGAFGFAGGFQFGLKALAAAILGGIGSVPGSLVGGVAVGLFETLWSATLPIDGRDVALYVALVIVIVIRPAGLFGSSEPAGSSR